MDEIKLSYSILLKTARKNIPSDLINTRMNINLFYSRVDCIICQINRMYYIRVFLYRRLPKNSYIIEV